MMNVLMFSPGFPAEMPEFTRALSQVGARVIGLGDQPSESLPELVRHHLSDYIQVSNLWDHQAILSQIRRRHLSLDRIECLWEPGIMVAAELRQALAIEGMGVGQARLFRDKELMKQAVEKSGLRVPRHRRASNVQEVQQASEEIGYPLIVKPISGAGSADTHRVEDADGLQGILPSLKHVAGISVEEFIQGQEYTFDTICAKGQVLHENVAWYRPPPLIARTVEWISPQTVSLRNVRCQAAVEGRRLGLDVLRALGFQTGFTHMEWFLTPNGEAVFGEIACRPPGARSVDVMNRACDLDLYRGWAEGSLTGRFTQTARRLYNAAVIFKRAQGQGRIRRIEGLQRLLYEFGRHVVDVDLLPLGAPRRNWKQTLLSDGCVTLRHPDLQTCLEMADRVGTELQLYAA